MSLLSDHDLKELINNQELRILPFHEDSMNPTSIDLRLGPIIVKYPPQTINIGNSNPITEEINIEPQGYVLSSGEFILGMTEEEVHIPNGYQGFIETKGNIARAGILVHNGSGHIDPGFTGHITLEMTNVHRSEVSVKIFSGIYICQLFIFKLSSLCDKPYKGKYLNQTRPTSYMP